jgi:hypothetical protein
LHQTFRSSFPPGLCSEASFKGETSGSARL